MNVTVINRLSEPTEIDFRPASVARLTEEQIAALPKNRRQVGMSIPPGRTELPKGVKVLTSEPHISVTYPAEPPPPTPPSGTPTKARTGARKRSGDGDGSE